MWILAAAITVVTSPAAVDTASQLTACVSVDKGTLYRVKEGSQPSEPCAAGDRTITWSIAGPPGPAGPATPAPPRFRFVGVTAQVFRGSGHRYDMHRACAAQYPGSRMAFADEISNTQPMPALQAAAWVQARLVVVNDSTGIDSAGNMFRSSGASFDCLSWTTEQPGMLGSAVGTTTDIQSVPCNALLAVGCSAPE